MRQIVDLENVSTSGVQSSPRRAALAGLRVNVELAAEVFAMLADSTRVRIILTLRAVGLPFLALSPWLIGFSAKRHEPKVSLSRDSPCPHFTHTRGASWSARGTEVAFSHQCFGAISASSA